jgi:hypothetical protein
VAAFDPVVVGDTVLEFSIDIELLGAGVAGPGIVVAMVVFIGEKLPFTIDAAVQYWSDEQRLVPLNIDT